MKHVLTSWIIVIGVMLAGCADVDVDQVGDGEPDGTAGPIEEIVTDAPDAVEDPNQQGDDIDTTGEAVTVTFAPGITYDETSGAILVQQTADFPILVMRYPAAGFETADETYLVALELRQGARTAEYVASDVASVQFSPAGSERIVRCDVPEGTVNIDEVDATTISGTFAMNADNCTYVNTEAGGNPSITQVDVEGSFQNVSLQR